MKKLEYLTDLQNPAAQHKRREYIHRTLDTGRRKNEVKYLWNGWFLGPYLLRFCCFNELYLPVTFEPIILKRSYTIIVHGKNEEEERTKNVIERQKQNKVQKLLERNEPTWLLKAYHKQTEYMP
jgi:hypothetical protein